MSAKRRKPARLRIGRVSIYFHHNAWWLYYRSGGKACRIKSGRCQLTAEQQARQIHSLLSLGQLSMPLNGTVDVDVLKQQFLDHHEHVRKSSMNTVRRYRAAIEHLVTFVKSLGRNVSLHLISVDAFVCYALLVKDCFAVLCAVGFDPYAGFYHTGRHGRPSLALDLMEEFRAIIADSVVLTLINNRIVAPDDFLTWRDACHLNETGRAKFFRTYEERKATEVRHPVYGYSMTYSRMIEVQARMLAAFLRSDIPNYVGFQVR